MKIQDIPSQAFAMPLTSAAFPPGPYRYVNREFLVITYQTDLDALRAAVQSPCK
jgi:acetoacetate decarboxylase